MTILDNNQPELTPCSARSPEVFLSPRSNKKMNNSNFDGTYQHVDEIAKAIAATDLRTVKVLHMLPLLD